MTNTAKVIDFPERPEDAVVACEDNLKFMRGPKDESMQPVVTSPPYNIGKSYEKKTSLQDYIAVQTAVIAEAVRVLSDKGSICWQVGNFVDRGEVFPLDIIVYRLFEDHGLKLRNRIVWTFGHGLHCSNRLSGRHETILWFAKSDDCVFNLDPIRVPAKYLGGPPGGVGHGPADVLGMGRYSGRRPPAAPEQGKVVS